MESKPDRDRAPELVVEKLAYSARPARNSSVLSRLPISSGQMSCIATTRDPGSLSGAQAGGADPPSCGGGGPAGAALAVAPALATALGVLVVGVGSGYLGELGPGRGRNVGSGAPESGDAVRIKGSGPRILVFRKQGDKAAQGGRAEGAGGISSSSALASGQRYGVIVSIDARGGATCTFPPRPPPAPSLHAAVRRCWIRPSA